MMIVTLVLRPKPCPLRRRSSQGLFTQVLRRFKIALTSSNPHPTKLLLPSILLDPFLHHRFNIVMWCLLVVLREFAPAQPRHLTTTLSQTSLCPAPCQWSSGRGCLRGQVPITTPWRMSHFPIMSNLSQTTTRWQTIPPPIQTQNLLKRYRRDKNQSDALGRPTLTSALNLGTNSTPTVCSL